VDFAICECTTIGGQRCGSPARNGQPYCYYHTGAPACLPRLRAIFHDKSPHLPGAPPMPEFPIPWLDDPAAIQIAYMQAEPSAGEIDAQP